MSGISLLKCIGQGGFASVFEAEWHGNKLLAVKRTTGSTRSSQRLCARQGVNLLRSLSHRSLVRFLGVEERLSHADFLIELCPRGTLHDLLYSSRYALFDVYSAAAQLVSAVHHCHHGLESHEIIHSDIKPANILVSERGVLKLCDFGLAKKQLRGHFQRLLFDGTPGYRAPEVLRKDPYNASIDLWSLGCTLYELFTLRTLYEEVGAFGTEVGNAVGLLKDRHYEVVSDRLRSEVREVIGRLVLPIHSKRITTVRLLARSSMCDWMIRSSVFLKTETATQADQLAVERDHQTLATGAPAPLETSTDVQGVGPSVYLTAVQPTTVRAPGKPRSEAGLAFPLKKLRIG